MKQSTADATVNVMAGLIVLAILIAAIVQAVQGDWMPAIFLAIIWNGIKSRRVRSD